LRCKPLEQDPAPRHSALQPAATKSGASQVGYIFGRKIASFLLTCFPRPAGFLSQKELYQLTKTCWTPYVIRWSIRDDAIRSLGTCIFLEQAYLIFLHFLYTGFFSIFTGVFFIFHGENSGLEDNIFLHFLEKNLA
jgi:hypothetical protein